MTRQELQNWFHALIVAIAVISAAFGAVTMAINQVYGNQVPSNVSMALLIVGSAITMVSKIIDSLHNAYTTTQLAQTQAALQASALAAGGGSGLSHPTTPPVPEMPPLPSGAGSTA